MNEIKKKCWMVENVEITMQKQLFMASFSGVLAYCETRS
jgi:hypothetical protein